MEFTTWPQVNMINQKNYYTYVGLPLFPLKNTPDFFVWTTWLGEKASWWAGRC
jgi:hypothetical protein